MSWRDVLDCKFFPMHISNFVKIVEMSGYKYFAWNGRIYKIHKVGEGHPVAYSETDLTVDDLK